MIPSFFPMMVIAELRKTFTRAGAIAALLVAFLVGLGTVGAVHYLHDMQGASINNTPVSELIQVSAVEATGYALRVRNFFVLPMFLVLSMASSVAGEFSDRTLRELLVRPVSRPSVLLAKLLAGSVLSFSTLLCTFVPAFLLGLLFFGLPEDPSKAIVNVMLGYLSSLMGDIGWLCVTMLVALFVQSTGLVVVGVVFGVAVDMALRAFLWVLAKLGAESTEKLLPFTVTNGLDAWQGWSEGWEWQRFLSLSLLILISLTLALARFRRMDVP